MLPSTALVNRVGDMAASWRQWFARVDAVVTAQTNVGETTARPGPRTAYVGMQFFDVTLGQPIWAAAVETAGAGGVTWVDATGTTV